MEQREPRDLVEHGLHVNEMVLSLLKEISRWARFLALVGFVMSALMLVSAVVLPRMLPSATYSEFDGTLRQDYTATGVTINFLILAVLMFLPSMYLFKFARKMQEALAVSLQEAFEDSFRNLKSTFKFYGIVTIIVLGVYALAFVMLLFMGIFQLAQIHL